MANIARVEELEGRQFFSSTLPGGVQTIGPSSGLVAAAVTPSVKAVTQPTGLSNVRRDTSIVCSLNLPNGAINFNRLYRTAFRIYQIDADGNRVGGAVPTGSLGTSGGGDTLSITPTDPLKANTTYRVEINQSYVASSDRIRDISGQILDAYAFVLTTGTEIAIADPNINFSQTTVAGSDNGQANAYTALTMGPDGKLYAATLDGYIFRWSINSDGTLAARQTITTILDTNVSTDNTAGNRVITGITFDPDATASNLKLWVSHGQYKFGSVAGSGTGSQYQADNYTGKVSVLSGANLQSYNDVIIGIPRSVKDHMNNQISFDRSGNNFFFAIPSMTAMGRADNVWGNRPEDALSGTIVKVNLAQLDAELTATGPLNLTNATYDATNSANALNIYATGVRNAYDMVFHSNGHLYSGVNGSSAGGNTPAGGGAPALTNVPQTEQDILLDVRQGKYYGHPNPVRSEYVLDGGNPTADVDPYEFAVNATAPANSLYPVGVQPDSNYTLPAYDLGKNVSPDGMIEYQGSAFGNRLKGALLICRYNSGQDILAVTPNSDGTISKSNVQARITGLTGLTNPLDIIEDTGNGNLYVAQLNEANLTGAITLMKPRGVDAHGGTSTDNPNPARSSVYVAPGNRKGLAKQVTLLNTGTTTMVVDVSLTKITGLQRFNFGVLDLGTDDIYILPGESRTFTVRGVLARGRGKSQR